jgi:hypothetical protein
MSRARNFARRSLNRGRGAGTVLVSLRPRRFGAAMRANVFGIRLVLTGILAVTAFGFVVRPGHAQPGRPPGGIAGVPGGGIAGMPGRPPGGITGTPGQPLRPPGSITGMPGGISGIGGAGFAGIHGAGIAGIHGAGIAGIHGAGIAGIHGAGIAGLPPGGFGGFPGQTTYSWSCGKCKAHLGTTTTPHSHHTRCPVCGVIFTGTTVNPGGGGDGGGAPGGFAPVPAPPGEAPPLPLNPAPAPPAPAPNPDAGPSFVAPAQDQGAPEPDDRPQTRTPRGFKIVAILIGSVMLLVGLAALVMVVRQSGGQPVRRPRRRFDDGDD